jgi:hypothetical protein
MHILVGVILHVTVLAIIGYFLLFSASKAQGIVALIGRLLGLWVFLLAILSVLAVLGAPMFAGTPFGTELMRAHGGMMRQWDRGQGPEQPAQTPGKP